MSSIFETMIRDALESATKKAGPAVENWFEKTVKEGGKDLLDRWVTRGGKAAADVHPSAAKVVEGFHLARENERMMFGEYHAARDNVLKQVDKGNMDFFKNYEEYFTKKKPLTHPSQQTLIDFDRNANIGTYVHSQKSGIPVGPPNPDDWSRIWEKGQYDKKFRDKAIDHLVKTNQAKNEAQAQELLDTWIEKSRGGQDANLRRARKIDLPGYRTDVYAPEDSMQSKVHDISKSRIFGPHSELYDQLMSDVRRSSYGNYKLVEQYVDTFLRKNGKYYTPTTTVEQTYNSLAVARFLGRTSIKHGSSVANVPVFSERMSNSFKALRDMVTDYGNATEFAIRSGSVMTNTLTQGRALYLHDFEGAGSKILKYTGFNMTDKLKRIFAANAGKHLMLELGDEFIETQSKEVEGKIRQLGADPASILKNGVTETDLLRAAQRMSDNTQFAYTVEQIPMGWRSSPLTRIITQFKPYVYMQGNFVKDNVIKPALKGNFKPLVYYGILFPSVGEVIGDLSNLAMHGNLERRPGGSDPLAKNFWLDRYVDNISYVAGFGMMHDFLYAVTSRRDTALTGLLGGPMLSEAQDLFNIRSSKHKGKALAYHTPIVGPIVSESMKPKSKRQKGILERGTLTKGLYRGFDALQEMVK